MNNFPKVSIVMVNYNGIQYLKRTLLAMQSLQYPNFEILVVDNGSTDGSIEYLKQFNGIKLVISPKIREKNFACNFAVEMAQGEYILMCDNDAMLTDSEILLRLVSLYRDEIGVISLGFYNEGEQLSGGYGGFFGKHFIKEAKKIPLESLKALHLKEIGFPNGLCFFVSKKKWDLVGGFDDYLKFGGDDNDLGIKLCLLGYKNILFSESLLIHIGMAERQDKVKYATKWGDMCFAHMYTIIKNYRFYNLILILPLYSAFSFLKSIKQALIRKHPGTFLAYFKAHYLLVKSIPHAINERRDFNRIRIVKDDIFLKIKPPEIVW